MYYVMDFPFKICCVKMYAFTQFDCLSLELNFNSEEGQINVFNYRTSKDLN